MNPDLENARDIFGGPRFYPAGEHPAGHRARVTLKRLQDFRSRVPDTPELLALIDWHERLLTAIEQGEIKAKLLYQLAHPASSEQEGNDGD